VIGKLAASTAVQDNSPTPTWHDWLAAIRQLLTAIKTSARPLTAILLRVYSVICPHPHQKWWRTQMSILFV